MSALCKVCGARFEPLSCDDRARYYADIAQALQLWARTSPHQRGLDNDVCQQLARATVYTELLLGAENGLCADCSSPRQP